MFLISNFEEENYKEQFLDEREHAKQYNVILSIISYEELLETIKNTNPSEGYSKMIEEFELYLDRNNLLPRWKYLLDVVNCAGSMEVVDNGAYISCDTGGSYSHRRAKFFGPYANKAVNKIFEIKACVHIEKDFTGKHEVKWQNISEKEDVLINEAIANIKESEFRLEEIKKVPIQVFLLEKGVDTNFKKESSGGMFTSKQYFWDIAKDCPDSASLAAKLKNKEWGDFK